jgi:copper homeostasis protein
MDQHVTIEICVGDIESAIVAQAGGADRVELCDNLGAGGTTPSYGTIAEACRQLNIPGHVLVRPREGDFIYSKAELAVMSHDIRVAKSLGAAGIVAGVLGTDGTIDHEQLVKLITLAKPLSFTFHKAFDQTRDLLESLDCLISFGVDRVLTSGGFPTAREGVNVLAQLVERAGARIAIMAGGSLALDNLESVIKAGGIREIHLGSAAIRTIHSRAMVPDHEESGCPWRQADPVRIAEIVAFVRSLCPTA